MRALAHLCTDVHGERIDAGGVLADARETPLVLQYAFYEPGKTCRDVGVDLAAPDGAVRPDFLVVRQHGARGLTGTRRGQHKVLEEPLAQAAVRLGEVVRVRQGTKQVRRLVYVRGNGQERRERLAGTREVCRGVREVCRGVPGGLPHPDICRLAKHYHHQQRRCK